MAFFYSGRDCLEPVLKSRALGFLITLHIVFLSTSTPNSTQLTAAGWNMFV
jgi:hypothetical protein